MAVVYYDAWKYGGEALRRNFISRSASELRFPREDRRWNDFHRGLYESRRRAEVERVSIARVLWPIIWRFAFLFSLLNAVFAVGVGCASVLTDENFFGEIGRVLPKALAGSGVVAVAVAAANALFVTSKVEIEESAPSADEQFSDTFRKLIKTVREGPEPEKGPGSWPG